MTSVTIEQIKRDLDAYLQRASSGETLLILSDGKPVAELKPPPAGEAKLRPYGLAAGQIEVADDFDAPLPEDMIRGFEGG